MVKLSDEERSFRKIGAGVPFGRFWHVPAIAIATFLAASTEPAIFAQCTGLSFQDGGKGAALLALVLTYPCSPYLLREGLWGALLLLGLWLPVPFAVINMFWQKRHRAFWDKIRARERERRNQRREQRRRAKEADQTGG